MFKKCRLKARDKLKGVLAYGEKKALLIVKKRRVLNVASIKIEKIAISDSHRKTKSINSKQIIQILQPIVIDYFSTHSYIVNTS